MTSFSGSNILAILTTKDNKEKVESGVPTFYLNNQGELKDVSMLLARILGAMVHDLKNGIFIIVRH